MYFVTKKKKEENDKNMHTIKRYKNQEEEEIYALA